MRLRSAVDGSLEVTYRSDRGGSGTLVSQNAERSVAWQFGNAGGEMQR